MPDGAVQTLCSVPGNQYGGTWNDDGTILFGSSETKGLRRVSASGGVPSQVTTLDASSGERRTPVAEVSPRWTSFPVPVPATDGGPARDLHRLAGRPEPRRAVQVRIHDGFRAAGSRVVRQRRRSARPAVRRERVAAPRRAGRRGRKRANDGCTDAQASACPRTACSSIVRRKACRRRIHSSRGSIGPERKSPALARRRPFAGSSCRPRKTGRCSTWKKETAPATCGLPTSNAARARD